VSRFFGPAKKLVQIFWTIEKVGPDFLDHRKSWSRFSGPAKKLVQIFWTSKKFGPDFLETQNWDRNERIIEHQEDD
jgi:hypothetical protein